MIIEEDALAHYGTKRHSGRYPWGSGGDETGSTSRSRTFLGVVDDLRKQGLSDTEIAKAMKLSTTEFRNLNSISVNERRAANITQAQRLADTGMGNSAIAKEMNTNESNVRSWLKPGQTLKIDRIAGTAAVLREAIKKKEYIDVGSGVEHYLGVSRPTLNTAIKVLKDEGYGYHYIKVQQLGTSHQTQMKVMSKPGVHTRDVYKNQHKITQISGYSPDGGKTYIAMHRPESISSKRVSVIWKEDGGHLADGVIYVRPGVKDTSLGGKNYAQVRIVVDGSHYLKGMAFYKEDLPKGVDLAFNTNKSKSDHGGDKLSAMKKVSDDPDNPFSASIKRQHGVMNLVSEEGDWTEWKRNFSSQFLSKQSPVLAKEQLAVTYERKRSELADIMALTNPTIRRKLLEEFADNVDSSAVHLEAASFPRTAAHVILPLKSIKETEVYAPNYANGDRVVLIRHPHGGTFELPELTVNNKNREARRNIGTSAKDAIGIHPKVAEKLSGADFDGDAVLVVRNPHGKIKTSPALEGLKNFDAKATYKGYPGMRLMTSRETQQEMGNISNLITDMTIKGASPNEIVRAVRHSMVVIDAEKHGLNYKQSEIDNGIKALKDQWQVTPGSKGRGASTLISKATSDLRVPERKQWAVTNVNKKTGEKIFKETGASYIDKNGKTVRRTTMSTKLAETKDANTLSSGTPIEKIYADHSNKLKALANQVRKEAINTNGLKYSPSAAKTYATEAASLKAKLVIAKKNAPLERQAQIVGNAIVKQKMDAHPNMSKEEIKKIKNTALQEARHTTGAYRKRVDITEAEWHAIQAGAISNTMLRDILLNTDIDKVKQYATPRSKLLMTSAKTIRAKSMLASGYTQAEVAEHLGVSLSTLKLAIK